MGPLIHNPGEPILVGSPATTSSTPPGVLFGLIGGGTKISIPPASSLGTRGVVINKLEWEPKHIAFWDLPKKVSTTISSVSGAASILIHSSTAPEFESESTDVSPETILVPGMAGSLMGTIILSGAFVKSSLTSATHTG